MATWLGLVVFAQFLFAVTVLIDKHIVARAENIGRPIVYAFYVSLLSGFVVILAPTGYVSWPNERVLFYSTLFAVAFTLAIYLLYNALSIARASDVAPVVGGVSAIAAAFFASLVIGDVVGAHIPALLLLALGTAVISHFHFSRRAFVFTCACGIAFAASVVAAKLVFLETTFVDGFFWTRMLNVVVALSLLTIPSLRNAILYGGKKSTTGAKGLVVGNKILGGIAAALVAYAISLGSVSLVNALAGLQFVFLFLFAIAFARHMPLFSEEKTGDHGGWHTGVGVSLIVAGLAALYLS